MDKSVIPELDVEGERAVLGDEDRRFIGESIQRHLANFSPPPVSENGTDRTIEDAIVIEQIRRLEEEVSGVAQIHSSLRAIEETMASYFTRTRALIESERQSSEPEPLLEDPCFDMADVDENPVTQLGEDLESLRRSVEAFARTQRWINPEEARDELIQLRKRIWEETGGGPSADGLLRRKMIDLFLDHRPKTLEDAEEGELRASLDQVNPTQLGYLDQVCEITGRVVEFGPRAIREETGLSHAAPERRDRESDGYWHVRLLTHQICRLNYRTPQFNLALLEDHINSRSPRKKIRKSTYIAMRYEIRFETIDGVVMCDVSSQINPKEFLERFDLNKQGV